MVCDMPEPCKFLCPDSCQKRFLGAHKAVDLNRQPVAGRWFCPPSRSPQANLHVVGMLQFMSLT